MAALAFSQACAANRVPAAASLVTVQKNSAVPVRPALTPAGFSTGAICQIQLEQSDFWGGDGLQKYDCRRNFSRNSALRRQRQRGGGLTCQAALGEYALATSAVYGTALLGGGLFAYLRSGSKGSLGGGVTGGVLLGATYLLLQNPETESTGLALGFGASLLFAAVFGIRLFATKKPLPAGPLLAISAAAAAVFASGYTS